MGCRTTPIALLTLSLVLLFPVAAATPTPLLGDEWKYMLLPNYLYNPHPATARLYPITAGLVAGAVSVVNGAFAQNASAPAETQARAIWVPVLGGADPARAIPALP